MNSIFVPMHNCNKSSQTYKLSQYLLARAGAGDDSRESLFT
jgi:hypothetical protein